MDVALSLATGLGLRVYLIRIASPISLVTTAALGLWEGVLVHQLSFHPHSSVPSPVLDHYLALGLRLVVDLLITKNWTRVIMVGLWAAIGTVISESMFPSPLTSFGSGIHKTSSRRDKEKRRRHSRSALLHVPSHIRIYQTPSVSPPSPPTPVPQTSKPAHPTIQLDTNVGPSSSQLITSPNFQPPSPPSFFLHADNEPSPFPESPSSPKPTTIISQIPRRPRSALAFYQEGEKGALSEPPSGPSRSPHLPTPPDSTIRERTIDSRVDRLSTIEELTSRSEQVTDIEQGEVEGEDNYILISRDGGTPLPVPNRTSQYVRADDGTPVPSVAPSVAPSAVPLPVPPVPSHPGTPSDGGDELRTPGRSVFEVGPDSDPDELKTPPALRARALAGVGTSTPNGANDSSRPEKGLSPLMWDSQSLAQDRDPIPVPETSLSTYAILQPPVSPVPLGELLDSVTAKESEIERPLSPSTVSDAQSVLSTRIPVTLLEHADDLRKQAIEERRELDRLRNELKLAQSEKRARDALFLREDIQNAEKRIARLDEKAARRYFAGRNNLQKPDTIDVHGLRPMEALQKTEQALRDLLRNGKSSLRVIVGRGLHSKGGVPVLKNYIIAEMQRQFIPCRVDPKNPGVLILTLSPYPTASEAAKGATYELV